MDKIRNRIYYTTRFTQKAIKHLLKCIAKILENPIIDYQSRNYEIAKSELASVYFLLEPPIINNAAIKHKGMVLDNDPRLSEFEQKLADLLEEFHE